MNGKTRIVGSDANAYSSRDRSIEEGNVEMHGKGTVFEISYLSGR